MNFECIECRKKHIFIYVLNEFLENVSVASEVMKRLESSKYKNT